MNATSERVLKALSRLEAAPAKPANDPVRRRGIELVQVLVRYFHIERDELRFRDWFSIVTEQDRRTINVGRAKPVAETSWASVAGPDSSASRILTVLSSTPTPEWISLSGTTLWADSAV